MHTCIPTWASMPLPARGTFLKCKSNHFPVLLKILQRLSTPHARWSPNSASSCTIWSLTPFPASRLTSWLPAPSHAPSSLGVPSPLLPLGLCTCCSLCLKVFTPILHLLTPPKLELLKLTVGWNKAGVFFFPFQPMMERCFCRIQ